MRNVLQDQYNPFFVYQLSNGANHNDGNSSNPGKKLATHVSGDAFKNLLDAQIKRLV